MTAISPVDQDMEHMSHVQGLDAENPQGQTMSIRPVPLMKYNGHARTVT
jgi:hypothetical protein